MFLNEKDKTAISKMNVPSHDITVERDSKKTTLTIRKAVTDDLKGIHEVLLETKLQTEGVAEHLEHFFVALIEEKIVGTIGLEYYGELALLRSASVLPSYQHLGLGNILVTTLEHHARKMNVKEVVLLTTTAAGYFRRKGFTDIDRKTISGAITTSAQFTTACPASASVMHKLLASAKHTQQVH